MKVPAVPVELKLALLAVSATLFYAWVGQLVPQKEVHPPEVVEIAADVTPEQMVGIGKQIFEGKGICVTCHTIGRSGALRFPDLEGIGTRAGSRVPGMSGIEYLVQTLYEPNVYIVPGFIPGMPPANKPPVGLTDDEIKAVIAYLQSLGGEVTVRMDMDLLDPEAGTAVETQTAEAAAAPGAGADPAASAAGGLSVAGALLASYGCTTCHYTDRPGELNGGPSLWDAGARMDHGRLLLETLYHEEPRSKGPQGIERIPVGELEEIVGYLSGLTGEPAGAGGGRTG